MSLQSARSAGHCIGQWGGLRGLDHGIAALQPRTGERLEANAMTPFSCGVSDLGGPAATWGSMLL